VQFRANSAPHPARSIWPRVVRNPGSFQIAAPLHWVMALAALGVILTTIPGALVRRSRRKSGRCLACGYELGEGRKKCPECGFESTESTTESTWTHFRRGFWGLARNGAAAALVLVIVFVGGFWLVHHADTNSSVRHELNLFNISWYRTECLPR